MIRDVEENLILYQLLPELCIESIKKIKDVGLLNVNFLNVLPNSEDELGENYEQIKENLLIAFKGDSLLPTQEGAHAPAGHLLNSSRAMQDFLKDVDLEMLSPKLQIYEDEDEKIIYKWASRPPTKSRAYRFVKDLEVRSWGFEDFISLLIEELNYSDFEVLWDIEGKVFKISKGEEQPELVNQDSAAVEYYWRPSFRMAPWSLLLFGSRVQKK